MSPSATRTQIPNRSSVQIAVPASAAYLRHVRIMAATVADDLGFAVDAIESLRVAVDELCALAIADVSDDAVLECTFSADGSTLVLEGRSGPVTADPELDPIAEQLLRAGSTSHDLTRDGDDCTFSLRADRPGT